MRHNTAHSYSQQFVRISEIQKREVTFENDLELNSSTEGENSLLLQQVKLLHFARLLVEKIHAFFPKAQNLEYC